MFARESAMTADERAEAVLGFATMLHVNGQSTDETVAAAGRLGQTLGLEAAIIPRWGELELGARHGRERLLSVVAAAPTGVDMERVASAMRLIDDAAAKRREPSLTAAIDAIAHAPPTPTWLFTLAAASGAAALSVIFGVRHVAAVALIMASAAIGALLRRLIARYSRNAFAQPFGASLLAGLIGAVAVRLDLSSSLRLVAVCPCMILVPGPHVLNGMMDLVAARVHLGACRLLYAGLIILAICAGLLLGLGALHVSLPVDQAGRTVPLWLDVIAAGVAVAAYSVFFSTPLRMLPWPIAIGMVAHALRWSTLAAGFGVAAGAFAACLFVGLILTPVARRWHMPFAAIGFASVVSLMPGVYLFRMASGLVELTNTATASWPVLSATIANATLAGVIVLAMTFGLIVPKLAVDRFQ